MSNLIGWGGMGMKDYSEDFRERLLVIEAESGIFELQVNGIRLWQYVRWFCLVDIMYDVTGIAGRVPFRGRMCRPKETMSLKERIARQQFLLRKKDLVVMNHPRRVKEGKYYRCFVTETLLENLDCSYYVFENEYRGQHFRPAPTKNLKYIDMRILRKIFNIKNDDTDKQLRLFYNKVMSIFEDDNKIKLSYEVKKEILNYIMNGYYEIYLWTIWAKIVFALVKPKALIVTSPYSPDAEAIIVEAKRQNIKTIELQHGITQGHFFYNYLYQGKVEIFPEYIFAYSKHDKDMQRYPIERERIIPVGYPDLEKKSKMYKKSKENSQKVMLFISTEKIVAEYAVKLRKDARLKDIRMIYKLHPDEYGQWKKEYPELDGSGLEIISENKHDIYYYLGHSDYVIGTLSTALYEAIAFDTEIFIIGGGSYRQSAMLYENGYAQLVTNTDMLVDNIINPAPNDSKNRKDYFEKNSIENMKRELNKIMSDDNIKRGNKYGCKRKNSGYNSRCNK